jgi:AAA domain
MINNSGPFEVSSGDAVSRRMTILLWGPAGDGKTTWAATAPGKKFWLSFGDNEHQSVLGRKDVEVMHLYKSSYEEILKHGRSENPFGLDHILAEDTAIETVVCDSVTALTDLALRQAVKMGLGGGKGLVPSMEHPGIGAYGGRNAITLDVLQKLLRITAKHDVHLIITAHEADPEKDDQGIVQFITIMLGGKLVNNVTWRLSEIWYLSQDSKGRQLAVRPTRKHRPMKSRMFTGVGEPEFILAYDSNKPDKGQMTIASFYEKWVKGESKLSIPASRRDK